MSVPALMLLCCCLVVPIAISAFNHPAGWHISSDIVRARALISSGREPWLSAVELLLNDTSLTEAYKPTPAAIVCRTCCSAVSYTHLTLPTKRIVEISVVVVSLKKKTYTDTVK
eukprot:TRINITY_DN62404_c0_g1_i1.p2 TRINITY_DN62404_c0_g1~~TRINITY_DN62404_c0_g1_i1.p2  ORF type:complete len:114 (+),score=21.54 TRINITY_DN62404_c0_g1_i1:189-530(+)